MQKYILLYYMMCILYRPNVRFVLFYGAKDLSEMFTNAKPSNIKNYLIYTFLTFSYCHTATQMLTINMFSLKMCRVPEDNNSYYYYYYY